MDATSADVFYATLDIGHIRDPHCELNLSGVLVVYKE
jgi:hypothetical protein